MDKIVVLDFGGQYSHLISRRVRELGVYSEVLPGDTSADELQNVANLKGIILSGGAASVYDETAPKCDHRIFELGVPILGICYGHQLIAYMNGGNVTYGESGEYGVTELRVLTTSKLFKGLSPIEKVWMNHRDVVKELPPDFKVVAVTDSSPVAAFENDTHKLYGVQFHPEVTHTPNGGKLLANFVFNICGARKEWSTANIIETIQNEIRDKLTHKKAIIGLSGGVDSSTAAVLVHNVIGKNLIAVYVDTGLMRYKETEFIQRTFARFDLNLHIIDAKDRFFNALKGVIDPEAKRQIIGKLFIDIFEEVATKEGATVLVQGTIYSDRIESGITRYSARIKSHHNVGGLPPTMKLEVYEPLRDLYKDEIRRIAKEIGLPDSIVSRHVFPGPGLAVRVVGEVTPEKVEIVRKASYIIEQELKAAHLYDKVWMAFAVLLPIKTVGIQGDARTYKYPIVVRIVESQDAMTANFAKLPYEVLERISTRITNEIDEVNRVVYDISNKPPATMEWE